MRAHDRGSRAPNGSQGDPPPEPARIQPVSAEDLRDALQNARFRAFSQPILDLRTGAVASEELLVRMVGTDGELISPAAFLPTAESAGLIAEIDTLMVQKGIVAATGGRRVLVNLSAEALTDPALIERIERASENGLDPHNLGFEISETNAGTNVEAALTLALELTRIGCDLSLDDFGSGFASLKFLKRLPVQAIKIDKDFVSDLPRSLADYHVVGCLTNLAHKLGRKTVAQGVEDGMTLELLGRLHVDYAQGYFIGMPREIDLSRKPEIEPEALAEQEPGESVPPPSKSAPPPPTESVPPPGV